MSNVKTVFKYDAGGRGFKRASLMAVFGIFWLYSWL